MIRYVVDAGVVIKWFAEEANSREARWLQKDEFELFAPDLLWPESGNILWKKVKRGELNALEARLIRRGLESQPIHTYSSEPLLEPALEIALDGGCSVYGGYYLALAMIIGCRLVTADQRLLNSLHLTYYDKYLQSLAQLSR